MKSSEWGTFIDKEWRQRKDEILELFPDIAKVFFFFLLSTVNMWGRKPLVLKLLRTFQCPLLDKHPSVFCWLVLVWQRRPGHTDSCWLFQATVLAVGRLSSHRTHTHKHRRFLQTRSILPNKYIFRSFQNMLWVEFLFLFSLAGVECGAGKTQRGNHRANCNWITPGELYYTRLGINSLRLSAGSKPGR